MHWEASGRLRISVFDLPFVCGNSKRVIFEETNYGGCLLEHYSCLTVQLFSVQSFLTSHHLSRQSIRYNEIPQVILRNLPRARKSSLFLSLMPPTALASIKDPADLERTRPSQS